MFTSPLQRARRTCELAGFGAVAEVDPDLVEWNYGEYEGRTHGRDSCRCARIGNCSATAARAANRRTRWARGPDRVREPGASASEADVLLFSSGHFLRVLAARWLGLGPAAGRYLLLSTASLSALGYEHNLSQPVIQLWNDTRHVGDLSETDSRHDNPTHKGNSLMGTKTAIEPANLESLTSLRNVAVNTGAARMNSRARENALYERHLCSTTSSISRLPTRASVLRLSPAPCGISFRSDG